MHYVPLETIIVPENRQRREFSPDALNILAESIFNRGLLHPLTLRDDSRTIVAGERRLRAIEILYKSGRSFSCGGVPVPDGCAPSLLLNELSPLDLEEVELEENVIRSDLTWKERVDAEARLHALRSQQAQTRGESQTITATASEIVGRPVAGGGITTVADSVFLHPFLNDPDVAGAKSKKEAVNIAKAKIAAELTAKLATTVSAAPTQQRIILGSCIDELPKLPVASVDIICVDPPYGIAADKMAAMSGSASGVRHEYTDDEVTAKSIWSTIFTEGARVCKPDAALYMFCDFYFFTHLQIEAKLFGWTPWPRPIIWHKPAGGMLGDSRHGPRRSYETIFYAYRGNMLTTGAYLDAIVMSPADANVHAAAKPVDLIVDLLKRHARPGMTVLDPCCGSGPIFPAANRLMLQAIGIEVVEKHYHTAMSRLGGKD